jgi:hypothetical protein
MKTFDPLAESVKRGVAAGDGDGAGGAAGAVWSVASRTAMIMWTHYTADETVSDLTDECSPKGKGWAAIALVGAKRIVVNRAAWRPKSVAADTEQECQNFFHDI